MKTLADHARAYRTRKAERIARMEAALREIIRRGELCIHQNTGRWDMSVEHDQRSYNIINTNNDIARAALAKPAKD